MIEKSFPSFCNMKNNRVQFSSPNFYYCIEFSKFHFGDEGIFIFFSFFKFSSIIPPLGIEFREYFGKFLEKRSARTKNFAERSIFFSFSSVFERPFLSCHKFLRVGCQTRPIFGNSVWVFEPPKCAK